MKNIAIAGPCVTENIGVEKIVKNLIAKPNIRFLINAGRKSKGHFVEDAFQNLYNNGIDKNNRIIGAKGNMPILKHLSKEEIEAFRKQVKPVNLIGETDSEVINAKVIECISVEKSKVKKLKGRKIKAPTLKKKKKQIKTIHAQEIKDIEMDPKGYFRVELDKNKKEIVVTHYNSKDEPDYKIRGKKAAAIYVTITREQLIGEFKEEVRHAAYIGAELAKAETALKNNLDYIEDEPIQFEKSAFAPPSSKFRRTSKASADKKESVDDEWFD